MTPSPRLAGLAAAALLAACSSRPWTRRDPKPGDGFNNAWRLARP